MPISLQLLLSDYERARAAGDAARADAILKQIEKAGVPSRLKPKTRRGGGRAAPDNQPWANAPSGVRIDPGRF